MSYYVVAVVADSYENLEGGATSVSGMKAATINEDGFVAHEPLEVNSSCVDPMVRLYDEDGNVIMYTMHRGVVDEGSTLEFRGKVSDGLRD